MKKVLLFLLAAITMITLTACNNNDTTDEDVVYVTLYPIRYLVEEIAGDTVRVEVVPGVASHSDSVDWSAKEIIDMADSDLLFFVNGGADSYISTQSDVFDGENVEIIDMSQHITYNEICLSHTHDDEEHDEEEHVDEVCDANSLTPDPHFWLDPVKMIQAAELIKTKLISEFPDNTELYTNNWTALNAGLEKLNQDFETMAENATYPIMTTVRLFTYWEERYDIHIMSITNDVHSSEGTIGDYTELLQEAVEHDIHYVCFETNANSPEGEVFLEALQDEYTQLGLETAEMVYLHGLGTITPDEEENGANYLSIMYHNLEVLNLITK